MSTVPSADAKAVVRAFDGLTTQVRRIADALTTPVVEYEVAADDAPTTPATTCSAQYTGPHNPPTACIRAAQHEHPFHTDEAGWNWRDDIAVYPVDPGVEHESDDATCRRMETRTCPPSYNGPCGDRPCARFESDDPTPWIDPAAEPGSVRIAHWHPLSEQLAGERQELAGMVDAFIDAQVQQARADEEQTLRLLRREGLLVLLSRLQRGRPVTEAEANTLRQHVETEIHEADTARSVAAGNKRHVQALVPDLERLQRENEQLLDEQAACIAAERRADTADRIRAEAQRDRDQHAAVLAEVLRQFSHETHPGQRCLQTGHVPVETVDRWRSVVAPTVERPWWEQVATAEAWIKSALDVIHEWQLNGEPNDYLTRVHRALNPPVSGNSTALDGTEQPDA